MIDPALLRDNLDAVRTALANRGVDMTRELEELAALEPAPAAKRAAKTKAKPAARKKKTTTTRASRPRD